MNTVNIQSVVGKEFSNCVTSPNHKMTRMIENINFHHAGGIYIHSQSSCSYIDASSCMNSVNLGYNNQSINQIIKNASSHISNFTSYLTNNSMYNLQSTDTQFFLCNADESTEKALEACKKMMNADDDFEIIALDLPQSCMSCKECFLCDMENRLNETLSSFEMEKQAAAIIIKPTLVSLCTFKMCRKIIDVLNELKQKGRILIISDERDIGYFRCGNKYYCDDICLNADIVVVSDNFFSGYFSKTMLVFKKRNF